MSDLVQVARIIRKHYDLDRDPTDEEIEGEIEMCKRHRANASGDGFIAMLAARLGAVGVDLGDHGSAL